MNGQLEFFGVDDMEPYRAAEHFMCTNIEWDPTGRYVATSVTSIHQMENGFNLWLFNGTPLYRSAARTEVLLSAILLMNLAKGLSERTYGGCSLYLFADMSSRESAVSTHVFIQTLAFFQ